VSLTPLSSPFADLDEAADRFASCRLSKREWTHEAHLAIGLWHVHRYGADEAVPRLRDGIRRLNDSHGTVNSSTGGYHETITRAYVVLLAQFDAACPPDMPMEGRVVRLLASPLSSRDALFRFYSREHLLRAVARAEWVEPDLGALSVAVLDAAGRIPRQ
jgi:hypothetical protein